MNKTTVIHHSADFDGLFCREIARKFLPDAELIGWDYGQPTIAFPVEGLVYILDLSPEAVTFPPCNSLNEKMACYNRMIWIDHHASSIAKFPASIPGYRIDGVAACRLAWAWFKSVPEHATPNFAGRGVEETLPSKQDFIDRKVNEPLAVRLAGEYDIWDKRDPNAELFQIGLLSRELNDVTWEYLLDADAEAAANDCVLDLLNRGEGVQYYVNTQNASIIKAAGFDIEFEGLKMLACNHARYNSHLFTAGIKPEHEALLGFAWRGGQWTVSLYHAPGKEHHDLSKIAVKYGGGGHKGACGFRVKTLPFLA